MESLDLNLLRVFDVIYRTRNVSRAAQQLGMSQPSTSQALTRLRLALGDPLFERTRGGVRPTPRADDLARSVQDGLAQLEAGLASEKPFDPQRSSAELRIHLTDIGEARFLPQLMRELRRVAPGIALKAQAWPQAEIAKALESGDLHLAIGFLPELTTANHAQLLTDRYAVLVRAGHPIATPLKRNTLSLVRLRSLDLIAVRSHAQTLQMLRTAHLEGQVKLTTSTFLALPDLVRSTDLGVLMPLAIAREFAPARRFLLLDTDLPSSEFTVSVYWSRRHEHMPLVRWSREVVLRLFRTHPY
ncbi:LysR substrate-binding domain-containing protein [Paracidovorax wautersii]|uniref:LysR substrate-binding domain-containing protein n=1 Tax=Paracidovorax wautersii TaxID=1177982 RepID=UPI0031CEAE77